MKPSLRNKTAVVCFLFINVLGYDTPYTMENQNSNTSAYKVGESFRDCEDDCPEMIVIPSGKFLMGSTIDEQRWFMVQGGSQQSADREKPIHEVTIDYEFAVGKYEITRGQFAKFINDTNYKPSKNSCYTYEKNAENIEYERKEREIRGWLNPGFDQEENHPVACISWHDAKAYITWLNMKTGKAYRLLTEAEWEYIARAGTSTYRYWHDDKSHKIGCDFANIKDQTPFPDGHIRSNHFTCHDTFFATAPVGSFKANAFGVYDMLGNQVEWVEDCWNDNHKNATDDGAPRLFGQCDLRILRGGSWYYNPINVRSAARFRVTSTNRGADFGFRIARFLDN